MKKLAGFNSMKKFASIYRHEGKEHTAYVYANDFDHAESIIDLAFRTNNLSLIDFIDDSFTEDDKRLRLRSMFYNGEVERVILTLGW